MIRKLGKQGEDTLLKNVISIVIFVASFALIVYGVYKIYNVFLDSEERNARETADKISKAIESLEESSGTVTVQGFRNSKDWWILSWSKTEAVATKPEKCYFQSCLCVCKGAGNLENRVMACQNEGFCELFEEDEIILRETQDNPVASVSGKHLYFLPENVDELGIYKDENAISITYTNPEEPLESQPYFGGMS